MLSNCSMIVAGAALAVLFGCLFGPMLSVAFVRLRRQGIFFALIGAGFLVAMATKPVTIDTASLPNAMEMALYNQTLTASGGTAPYAWSDGGQIASYEESNSWATFGTMGEATGWCADDGVWTLDLPFAFPYYGTRYTKVYVNSNGGIYFDSANQSRVSSLSSTRAITPFGNRDLHTGRTGDDIYIVTNRSDYAVVRWSATRYSGDSGAETSTLHFAVVLYANGQIRFVYGDMPEDDLEENITMGVGSGSSSKYYQEDPKPSPAALSGRNDVVFYMSNLPDGMTFFAAGVISGTASAAGNYGLVAMVTDSASSTASKYLPLVVEENPNRPPVIGGQTPAATGATVAHGESIEFTVTATDPEGVSLHYAWKKNGVSVGAADAPSWTWTTDFCDGGSFTVTCDISDGLWTKTATWNVYVTRGLSWYVNGTTGLDTSTGYEEASPFKTITNALAKAIDGETILVAEGTYKEGYFGSGDKKYPNLTVTDGRHLTIRATGARDATIIDAENQSSCLWLNTDQEINTNVVVEGFTLQNGNGSFLTGVNNGGGGSFGGWLKNCRIVDCSASDGGGAWCAKLENCTVEGCFAQYHGAGLYECEADRCRIVGNVISNCSGSVSGAGVCGGTTANSLVACNLIDATCTYVGYGAGAARGAKLINCTVTANTNNAATANGGGLDNYLLSVSIRNTIIFGNVSKGVADDLYLGGTSYESYFKNCCTNDPSFKNAAAGNFSLRPTSVCHNAGDNAYAKGTLDCAGAARIQEGKVDIGAFEYTPIMTITAAPIQATAGTPYSYTLTQSGGAEPIDWSIDDSPDTLNTIGEVAESSSFALVGEKVCDLNGGSWQYIDLPFDFPYGGATYARAAISAYGDITLGNESSFDVYSSYGNKITDSAILSKPVILPNLAFNWGTYSVEGGGIFVDRSVNGQITIRWATKYVNNCRANFSATLFADGKIRFSYGDIDDEYGTPTAVGLSFGDGHYVDTLESCTGSNCKDIVFSKLGIPEGISLSGAELTGTPAKGGTYRFRVNATEAGGESQSKIVTMDVLSNYTLHFDGNGNKAGTAPADKALTSVEEYTLPEPGMTCGCARFLGWATNATTAALYQAGDKVKCLTSEPGGNFTLYAAWEDVFVVNFDMNAANVLGGHRSYTNATGTGFYVYTYDGKTNVVDGSSHDAPCRVGWVLHNWNMSPDGTGTKVCEQKGAEWVTAVTFGASRGDTITLYAQWQECIWDFYWADPQLLAGKWQIRVKGDEYAELSSVSSAVFPADLTLPQTYGGRTVSSYTATLTSLFNRDSVRSITIPEGYTNIRQYAFNYVYSLESIVFPSTLKKIPYYCCQGCTNLASVTFAEGNEIIDGYAFSGCKRLPSVTMPDGLTNVCNSAFYQCTNLTQCVLAGDYIGSKYATSVFEDSPIVKLEIPASCVCFGSYAFNKTKALRFIGDRPTWDVYGANKGAATLIEFPATNATWNAGKIPYYASVPHKGFVGPVNVFGVTDSYFWTNANKKVTFAYAESALAATITIPAGTISWGGEEWEIAGFESDAFAGQPTTTVYYPIAEYSKWEAVTPPAGITLAPIPGTFFTLNFHTNGGDAYVPAAMTFPPSATRALPAAKPTKTSYKFLGWATTADGEVVYQPGDNYTAGAANASATLYAKWKEVGNYTIHFEGNSAWATSVPADIVAAVETTPAIPADPSREGWAFGGWTNAVNDHVYQAGDAFDEGCAVNTTFTLYAKWTVTTVSNLDYTDGDGTVWTYNRTGDSVTITKVVPGPGVETLELPESIKGSTVVKKASGYNLPEKVNGLWWNYTELANNCAKLTSVILSGPTDLVMPSEIAGRTVTAFATVGSLVTNRNYVTSVEIPGTVTAIPQDAFYNCQNLTEIVLHEGTVSIGSCAFGYTALAAPIDFPTSLTNVHPAAFEYVDSVPYDEDGFMYADTGKTYLQRVRKDVAYAPEGVKTLADQAFGRTECAKITVPESVEVYGVCLFNYLTTLREVVFKSPAALSYNSMFYQTSSVTNITLYGGEQEVGSFADSPSHITTVGFLTTPPSWNVTEKFPYATTVCYYANYAADWADYKTAHPSYTYVELAPLCVEATVGHYIELDLEEDLGIEIDAAYTNGDKVTVKIEGLAKGLKLVTTPIKVIVGKKTVISGYVYTIAGVPTEAVDFATQPMFARVTVTKGKVKTETLTALKLQINPAKVLEFSQTTIGSNYVASVQDLWPEADATWTFKGWPAGLKYTAKDVLAKDKSVLYEAFTVYGKPTKAGVYTITASHKETFVTQIGDIKLTTTATETETATLTVWGDECEKACRYTDQVGVAMKTVTTNASWKTVAGLPTGIKWTTKEIKAKKGTPAYPAYSLYGTPTKAGVFATTVTKVDPLNPKKTVKETFLWKVTEGANDGFLGAIDWEVRDSTVTVMQGVIQTNWNVTVDAAAKVTASGLPTGLKLAQNRLTGEWYLEGTPTKTGNFVVTFKTVLNGVTKTERIAMSVTENAYTGNWYAAPLDDHTASWTAYISVAAGGTVKLTLTEGTTNTNAKGVIQSQVSKTTVTAKNFDGDGKSVSFTLPRDKKVAGSVDRSCVVDFDEKTIKINGEEQCAEIYYQAPFDFDVPEVATMVLEEFVEDKVAGNSTNAFAYLTATYNAAKGLVGVQGKLYDGTAVKATTYALEGANGGCAPFLVTDKSKNSISILISYTANYVKGEFRLMQCAVFVNGQILRIGKAGLNPSWDGFDSAEAKVLKATKFSDMTSATNLVIEADEPIALAIPVKSLATKLTAQGLVTFKNLKDADGISWTCELLPVGKMMEGDTPFRGIATGTWRNPITRKTETFACPVRTE